MVLEVGRKLRISFQGFQFLLREWTVGSSQSTHSTSWHSHSWHTHARHAAHSWHSSHSCSGFFHFSLITQLLALSISWIFFHTDIILFNGLIELALSLQNHRFPLVPF